jgi:hypothetical protein
VTLEVSHPLKSPLKALAKINIRDYMMNTATMQMSVMEEKEINCTSHFNVHMKKLQIKNIIDLQK